MKRKNFRFSFALLVPFLFSLFLIPEKAVNEMRSSAVGSLLPFWRCGTKLQEYLADRPIGKKGFLKTEAQDPIFLENIRLKNQLELAYDWTFSQKWVEKEARLQAERKLDTSLAQRVDLQYLGAAATVTYRDPTSWSSSLWIDLGEEANSQKTDKIIEKNSPVIAKGSVIGIVDYVGKRQSRVRLITDSGVSPAVRVARGNLQNSHLAFELDVLQELIEKRDDLFSSPVEKGGFVKALEGIKTKLTLDQGDLFLAKGELYGSSGSLWRAERPLLKGVGFNFDFPDEEGSLGFRQKIEGRPILKEGDLLVTSGLDGVFPPGLTVGTVVKVGQSRGFCYEIEARPTAVDLNHLKLVFVLPSLSSE